MRRLNVRLLVILVVSLGLGAALMQGVHAIQVRRHSGAFLREADRAEKEGKRREATDDLKKYLLLVPDDTKAMVRLGNLLFDQSRDRESQTILGQVVQREPKNDEIRRKLVDISLRQRRYQDARYQLEKFLLITHPNDGQLYFQLGTCQQALGEYSAAATAYRQAIKLKPDLLAADERLAGLLADRLDSSAAAVTLLDQMVTQNPQKSAAYLMRGKFLQMHAGQPLVQAAVLGTGKVADSQRQAAVQRRSFADAQRALELAPNDPESLVFGAESAYVNGSTKEAQEIAERVIRRDPKIPASYFVLASLEMRAGRPKGAATWLQKGLDATGGDNLLLWTLAAIDIDTNNIPEARKLVDQLRPATGTRPIVQYLEARILITESKWADASHKLKGLGSDLRPWPQFQKESQLWLGRCYERLGRDDLRVEACRAALEADPQWAPARLALADALRAVGRTDEAMVEYQRLRQLPNAAGALSLPMLRLEILANLSKPRDAQNWPSIEKQLDQAAKDQPAASVALLKAEVQMAQGHIDPARQLLRAAIKQQPQDLPLWNGLITIAVRQGKWEEVEKLLHDAGQRIGDPVALRLAKAEYWLHRYGAAKKEDLRKLASPPNSYSAADRLNLARGMAGFALAIRDYEQADRLCRMVADAEPTNLQIRLILFDLASLTGRTEAIVRTLAEVKGIEQDGPYSRYGKALRLSVQGKKDKDEKRLDEALQELSAASALRSDWSRIPLLVGDINDFRGKRDVAIENYLKAYELGERNPRVMARLVGLLYEQKDNPKAESIIQKLQEEKAPISVDLARVESEVYAQSGAFKLATDLARRTADQSHEIRDRLWYGQMLRISGRLEDAEAEFLKATALAPNDSATWIALIQSDIARGKTEQARKTLAEAKSKVDEKRFPLALVYAYELLGQVSDVERQYQAAIKASPQDVRIRQSLAQFKLRSGKSDEAQAILREMLGESTPSTDQATREWARRELAGILAASGNYQKYLEARSFLEENLKSATSSDVDRRAMALVNASFPTRENMRNAIRDLEALAPKRGVLLLDDRLVLAKMCLLDGNWPKASKIMREVATESKDPAHVAAYAEALINHNELADAEAWTDRLEKMALNDFPTADVRARLLMRQKRSSDALNRLVEIFKPGPRDPRVRTQWKRSAAARLGEFGNELAASGNKSDAERFLAQAETFLRDVERDSPTSAADHVRLLVQSGRKEDAIAEFQRVWKTAPPAELDALCASLSKLGSTDAHWSERVDPLLQEAGEKRSTLAAWLMLAELRDRLGNYDGAEQSLRQALKIDANNIVALNNLAYLLALRETHLPDAQVLIDRAIAQAGPRAALVDTRALVHLASGQNAEALTDTEIAIGSERAAVHFFHDARAQLANGRSAAARKSWEEATQRGLTSGHIHPLEQPAFRALQAELDAKGR